LIYLHTTPYHLLILCFILLSILLPPRSTLFPYTTLFRSRLFLLGATRGLGSLHYCYKSQRCLPIWNYLFSMFRVRNQLNKRNCRSEEHTSELQSRFDLVCRLLLETKN